MPCGGCGGGDIKIAPRRPTSSTLKKMPLGIQREMRPKPIQKVVSSPELSTHYKVRPLQLAKVTGSRAKDVRLCPVCGASLSIEITGRTRRKRFRCTRCQKTYT